MAIQFDSIPSSQLLPLFFAEFSGTAPVGQGDLVKPTLICGQKLAAGTGATGTPLRVTSVAEAITLFGRGSVLHLACKRFFAQHPTGDLRVIALADESGTNASATATVTGPPTASGSIYLRIGDSLVEVAVASGADADDIAADLAEAINANADLPVTAAVGTAPDEHVVTITHRHDGTIGNQVPLTLNALGQPGGETLPAGIGVTLSAGKLASGATDPSVSGYITAMGDEAFDVIVPLLGNATTLAAFKTEMARRWGPTVALYGHVFSAELDSAADLITYAEARNDKHLSILGLRESSPHTWLTPAYEVAAAYGGAAALMLGTDPGASLQYKVLTGVWGGTTFSATERGQLAAAGCGTVIKTAGGEAAIEAEVTTYTENAAGAQDLAWQYTQNPFLLQRFSRLMRARFETRYPSFKLGDDGNPFSAGQRVITPSVAKAEIVSIYAEMVAAAQMEGLAAFKESIVVERNATNRNRLDVLVRPDLINHLRVVASRIEFEV